MIDKGGSLANASCIDGKECRCADGGSLSSSTALRFSVGDMCPPPWPMTELAVDDGYEYGGGGPEYMFDGLTRGGAVVFRAAETGSLGL